MSRRPNTIRPVRCQICLPEDIAARIALELFSEVEGKIPYGKWSDYFVGLARADLARIDAARRVTNTNELSRALQELQT